MATADPKLSEAERFEALVTAAKRLSPDQLKRLPAATQSAYTSARTTFLNKCFAFIELGVLEPFWSTFSVRLDYVLERTGMQQQEWAKKAGVATGYISDYRKRERSAAQQGVDESCFALARHVLALLRAAGQPVELAWVLGGSGATDGRSFRARYVFILRLHFGKEWRTAARSAKLFPEALAEALGSDTTCSEEEQQRLAKALSALIGPAITATWLMTGKTAPPPEIRAAMTAITAAGPVRRWDQDFPPRVSVTLTPTTLLKLVQVIEDHAGELSSDTLADLREHLWAPLVQHGVGGGGTHSVRRDQLTEDAIRENRALWLRYAESGRIGMPLTPVDKPLGSSTGAGNRKRGPRPGA